MIWNWLLSGLVCMCGIGGPVEGPYQPAERLNPPVTTTTTIPAPPALWTTESSNGRCTGMQFALEYWNPGWNVDRMMQIAYRESRCVPTAANSCCTGIFQIHAIWLPRGAMCGVYSREDLKDPWKNVCVARIIYQTQGMQAWAQTN